MRLCAQEIVQIILPPPRVPAPGRAAEHRRSVVGRAAIRLGVGPHIPIGVRPLAPRAARSEPLMLIRGVRPDRKSVVSGKSVSVRVDLGGSRIIKKTKTNQPTIIIETIPVHFTNP